MGEIIRHEQGVTLTIENHEDRTSLRIPLGEVEIRESRRDLFARDWDLSEQHRRSYPLDSPIIESLTLDGIGKADDGRPIRVHVRIEY